MKNKKQQQLPLIAITMGDPAGIGPEIILKMCMDPDIEKVCRLVVLGSLQVFSSYKKKLGIDVDLIMCKNISSGSYSTGTLPIWPVQGCEAVKVGLPTGESGLSSALCIAEAVKLLFAKKVDAMTTAPISKLAFHLGGFRYPGHTEMLADLTAAKQVVMMLTGGGMRVALATTHLPVSKVNSMLSTGKIEKLIQIIHSGMPRLGVENPKIAVCSLNPHGGENGLFGNEEETIITPAIANSKNRGILVDGPYPADTLFVPKTQKKYDVILAMYHDQGLIPLKMTAFGRSVNVTLGLPLIRTSCDHGTAYDIAGQNCANPESIKEAVKLAAFMTKFKDTYKKK